MQSFFIQKQLPGLNEIIAASKVRFGGGGQRRSYQYAAMKTEFDTIIGASIIEHRLKPVKFRQDFWFQWIEPNARRDPNNIHAGNKFIFDALEKSGIIPKDSQKWVARVVHEPIVVDKNKPGVIVMFCNSGETMVAG